jgi:RNA polymerase sigma-70 factor (ECF subfamily)
VLLSDEDPALSAAFQSARAQWPEVDLDPIRFNDYLIQRSPQGAAGLRTAELYLTCACVNRSERAIATLERGYFPALRGTLGRMFTDSDSVEDALGAFREHLFVAPAGSQPRIAEYSGRGELAGWLKVSAVRLTLRGRQRVARLVATDDAELAALGGDTGDPELEHLKRQSLAEFRAAFGEALARLNPRDRNLLRFHYLEGVTTEQVGSLYHVHRATAVRWIAAARESLVSLTRAELTQRLRLSPNQFDSLMKGIESRLDMSLGGLLGKISDESGPR